MNRITNSLIASILMALAGSWATSQVDLVTFNSGDLIRAEEVNDNFQQLADELARLADEEPAPQQPQPAASIRNGLQQEIPTNDETLVTFDEVEFEQGGTFFSATEPSRLTAPENGLYVIDVQVSWRPEPNDGFISSSLYINSDGSCSGSSVNNKAHARGFARVNAGAVQHLSLLKQLEAGDYIELCVVQGTGDAKFVEGFGESWATMRMVSRIE